MLDLTRSTIRRAGQVRLPQAAASLTLTTALSIVPLLAVVFRRQSLGDVNDSMPRASF